MSRPNAKRGPGRPPGADGAETRLRILHSARQVFSTTGFDRASLKQIAEDAGVTRNAIANYYPGKAELYVAALASIQEVAIPQILEAAAAVDGPVHRRIMAVVEAATSFSRTDDTFVRFFVTSTVDATHHPELRDRSLQPIASVHDFIAGSLEDAQRRGEISADLEVAAVTQVVIDVLWGLAMDTGFYSSPDRVQRTVEALGQLLAAALGQQRAAAPPARRARGTVRGGQRGVT